MSCCRSGVHLNVEALSEVLADDGLLVSARAETTFRFKKCPLLTAFLLQFLSLVSLERLSGDMLSIKFSGSSTRVSSWVPRDRIKREHDCKLLKFSLFVPDLRSKQQQPRK